MKIRGGFVSNSSSSSFVLICEKKILDEEWDSFHPYIKAILAHLKNKPTKPFLGKECLVHTGVYNSEDGDMEFIDNYEGNILISPDKEVVLGTEEYRELKGGYWYDAMSSTDAMRHVSTVLNEKNEGSSFYCEDY